MDDKLRETTNKEKTISIKNNFLNDLLSCMVDKRLI